MEVGQRPSLQILHDHPFDLLDGIGFIMAGEGILVGHRRFYVFDRMAKAFQQTLKLAKVVETLNAPPMLIMIVMLTIYLVLGCVMESLAMILLTVPVFFPIVLSLDLGLEEDQVAVWFGIVALMAVEVGMITPPFGLKYVNAGIMGLYCFQRICVGVCCKDSCPPFGEVFNDYFSDTSHALN